MLNMANAVANQPMEKVKGLLSEMIKKLTEEAAEAATTHAFCEAENEKNKDAKKKTNDKLTNLKLRINKATSRRAELLDQVTEQTENIAEIDSSDAEAASIRNEENASFKKNEADFQEAASAVLDAIDVLKDFYGGDALLQMSSKIEAPGDAVDVTTKSPIAVQAPDMGGARRDSSSNILMMLDTMADEFSKSVAELQSTERQSKKAYEKMKNENQVSKASKEAEIKGSNSEIQMLEVNIGDLEDDRSMNQDEMSALLEYIEKLKPTCVGVVMPYAERKAKREAEIDGLKTALEILDQTDETLKTVSFLQK